MRGTSYIAVILLVLLTPALAVNTYGFEVSKTISDAEIRWDSTEVSYQLNPSGGPAGSLAAIQASMATWTAVAASDFSFDYNGTTAKSICDLDYENIVTFGVLGADTLAQNAFWYYTATGEIVDSDIEVNSIYAWSTNGSAGTYDLQNVCTHEFGHSLSLADLYNAADSEKTMYYMAGVEETKKRTLHRDDINGIAYLYPHSGGDPDPHPDPGPAGPNGITMPWVLQLLLDDES
jgi:hypothetical protein